MAINDKINKLYGNDEKMDYWEINYLQEKLQKYHVQGVRKKSSSSDYY